MTGIAHNLLHDSPLAETTMLAADEFAQYAALEVELHDWELAIWRALDLYAPPEVLSAYEQLVQTVPLVQVLDWLCGLPAPYLGLP